MQFHLRFAAYCHSLVDWLELHAHRERFHVELRTR
jgi:hypothetical protein